jgi:hypothetical protein
MPSTEGRGPEAQRAVEQAERRHIESYSLLRVWERFSLGACVVTVLGCV